MSDQIEKIYNRLTRRENLCMWGHLYLSKTGQSGGGWLVDSWSEHGAPYWLPKMHWVERPENKLSHTYLNMGYGGAIQLRSEDTGVEPDRAIFIRGMVEQWALEWLKEQENKI
jgi:hypothetical protein